MAVRRRWWVLTVAVAWIAAGAWAVMQTPIDAVPDLSENQVIVSADWPGHGPEDVDRHVTYPLSLWFDGLPGLRVARGASDVGTALVYLIFDDDVSFPEARRRVQERLATAPPKDLPPGVVARLAADGIPTGQIFWYTVEGTGLDLGALRALQDWSIAPQLRSVAGVAEVASVGGFVREVQIRLDLPRLSAAGLAIEDVEAAVASASRTIGGHVLQKGNAEFIVQVGPRQPDGDSADRFGLAKLEQLIVSAPGGGVRLGSLGDVALGSVPRRGMLEKDGNEVVGGVVHLRYGHNPLAVTREVKARIREIQTGLPGDVRIIPCYDRTPLIQGAVGTVTRTLIEAIIAATVCVVLILRHVRASLVIAATLPLAVLGAFLGMSLLRATGIADVQTNIMSLAGIVISIGVLVDSSIVMTENVMHRLRRRFGERPVTGDQSAIVIRACQSVGRPLFFSILIMLVSFLPVFTLGGIDGRMYAPLAWTKTLAVGASALLALTLVPALSSILIRGRIRDESESAIVRSVVDVYRPILTHLMDHPGPLLWILSATFVLAAAPLGSRPLLLTVLAAGLLLCGISLRSRAGRATGLASLVLIALVAEQQVRPLAQEMRLPLNEGMVMDMPISVPRASITQSGDDVKARDMVLCRFPEVQMVVGKAGRAETPFDPAPLDMIETMIEFRPADRWPRRRLDRSDAQRQTQAVLQALVDGGLVAPPAAAPLVVADAVDAGLPRYDAVQREVCHLRIQEFLRTLPLALGETLVAALGELLADDNRLVRPLTAGDIAAVQSGLRPRLLSELSATPTESLVEMLAGDAVAVLSQEKLLKPPAAGEPPPQGQPATDDSAQARSQASISDDELASLVQTIARAHGRRWRDFRPELDATALRYAAPLWTRIAAEELISRLDLLDEPLANVLRQGYAARYAAPPTHHPAAELESGEPESGDEHHHGFEPLSILPLIDPHPVFDALQRSLSQQFGDGLALDRHTHDSLSGFGGEMDRALQMPGWTNVWTKPIQNRVDMLTTGVNAEVGVRVLGRRLDDVVRASESIADSLRALRGAANVVADPIRGKGYVRITPDPARAAALGVSLGDLNDVVQVALGGREVAHQFAGRERLSVRVVAAPQGVLDEQSLKRLPVPRRAPSGIGTVTLDSVADVTVTEGPATIRSENGWMRNYVRLNVRERDVLEFVDEAKRVVAAQVTLPPGVFVEWTGQFEHSLQARRTLLFLTPVVCALIVLILYVAYRDWADAMLMVLVLPGALAGGLICQWLLGYPFSISVGVGYIACFGMASATGIVMLVYLREAVDDAGGLAAMTPDDLRQAVLNGAVHRLRPKLLTEATTILGLAPMLWSTGVGAEVIRPMAAPVLGGLLIADEVIDLLLPVLFYRVRRRRLHQLQRSHDATRLVPETGIEPNPDAIPVPTPAASAAS